MTNKAADRRFQRTEDGVRVSFSLTWAFVILVAVGVVLIVSYILSPSARPVLSFTVGVLATLGGVAGAYYVGRGLRATAQSERVSRSFSYPARWGDPAWAEARVTLAELLATCQGKSDDERLRLVESAMEGKPRLEGDIRAVLNFLEEFALAINLGVVEEDVLDRFYRTMVVRAYGALAPWVKKHRQEREAPRIWVEVEALFAKWERKG